MKTILRPALVLFVGLSLLCCGLYPAIVTGVGRLLFPHEAAGGLLYRDGKPVGASLIGQAFSAPRFFWGRPSATTPMPANAASSAGSNLGPGNPALRDAIAGRIAILKAADPGNLLPVPVDLVTASASGLDPDISLAAAEYQAARVARARGLSLAAVQGMIAQQAHARLLGFFGEPRINVLQLNLSLDRLR